MVRRDEVGTNNYDVENLEEMVSAFWDEEREMLEAFQAMLKSLTNLGDGVFVNTQKAIRNEQKGEEHIRSLPLNAVGSVSVKPMDYTEIFHIEVDKADGDYDDRTIFNSFYYVSINLKQFMFQKFGYWWLISTLYGTSYQVHLFKKQPNSLWLSGGGAIVAEMKPFKKKDGTYVLNQTNGRTDLFQIQKPRFTSHNVASMDEEDFVEKYGLERGYRRGVEGRNKNYFTTPNRFWGAYQRDKDIDYVNADAVWTLTTEIVYSQGKRSEMPRGQNPYFDTGEGNPDDYVTWSEHKLKVKREYGWALALFKAWQNDFDYEQMCEDYVLEGWNKRKVYLNKKPQTGFMSEGDYWNHFDDERGFDYANLYGGFNGRELTFPFPTLYQYKRAFGILNHYAV